MANNHALDFEEWALAETLAVLDHAGIAVTGAGRGLARARSPAVVSAAGGRVGVIASSDHRVEYAAGDDDRLGSRIPTFAASYPTGCARSWRRYARAVMS